jgi:hypothetical protein
MPIRGPDCLPFDMQQTTTAEVFLDERKAARFRATVQSTGEVRVPAAQAVRDVPLPKTPEGAIMAHNPPQNPENVGLND